MSGIFAVSSLLDSLVDDKGKEQLLVCWYLPTVHQIEEQQTSCSGAGGHGRCTAAHCQAMQRITVGTRDDIGRDYAGLCEDLSQRQTARVAQGGIGASINIGRPLKPKD